MIRNYLVTALRNFRKNKVYTILNILSLSFGITVCITQYAILRHEFTFDDFHHKKDQIYRVVSHHATEGGMSYSGILPNPLAKTLDEEKSYIEDVIAMHGPVHSKVKFNRAGKVEIFTEPRVVYTDQSFLKHLDFELLKGGPIELLDEKGHVFITERLAERYFGTMDPLGATLTIDDNLHLEVAGILKNPPSNTNVPFNMLIPNKHLKDAYSDYVENWDATWVGSAYIVINPNDDMAKIETELNQILAKHISAEDKLVKTLFTQPLSEVHTNDKYTNAVNYVPPSKVLLGTVLMVILILVISILNFVNLATSQSIQRAKEIGIRKTLGGQKRELVLQFLFETMILVSVSIILGLTLGQIVMDMLNGTLSGMSFYLSYDNTIYLFVLALLVVVTAVAGFYPAVILTRFNPVDTIRRKVSLAKHSGNFPLRKVLITTQFVIANFLIFGTIISTSQLSFMQSKDLGFDAENVVILPFSNKSNEQMATIRYEYAQLSFVEKATWSFTPPQTGNSWNTNYNIVGMPSNDDLKTNMKFIDDQYIALYNIELLYGRNITNTFNSDTTQSFLVTNAMIQELGLTPDQALTTEIEFNGNFRGKIVGVLEDFHVSKLNRSIKPVVLFHNPESMRQIHLKMASGDLHLSELETLYRRFDDEALFEPSILTDRITQTYKFERIIHSSVIFLAVTAALISLMGLYGLVSFMIAKNKKAFTIRKIFGASSGRLLLRMTKEYASLIIVGYVLSAPLGALAMNNWLNGFYYHIDISVWHYLASLILILTISGVTVGYKSYKSAAANPVDDLRYE